jgi:hypothetical protein
MMRRMNSVPRPKNRRPFFNFKPITEYFRNLPVKSGPRRAQRLPVKIPALYCAESRGSGSDHYHECLIEDVSKKGLGIEIRDVYPADRRRFIRKMHKIFLKVDLPYKKNPVEVTGLIRWFNSPDPDANPATFSLGIEYKGLGLNTRIDILQMGLQQVRLRNVINAFILALGLLVLGSLSWGLYWNQMESKIQKKLIVAEKTNTELKNEIRRAALDVIRLEDNIEKKKEEIQARDHEISDREQKLAERSHEMVQLDMKLWDRSKEVTHLDNLLATRQAAIAQLSNEIEKKSEYLNVVHGMVDEIGEEFDLSTSARMVFLDNRYTQAKDELVKGNPEKAVKLFKALMDKYPDSIACTRLLYISLWQSGRKDEAEDFLNRYLQKMKKTMIRNRDQKKT